MPTADHGTVEGVGRRQAVQLKAGWIAVVGAVQELTKEQFTGGEFDRLAGPANVTLERLSTTLAQTAAVALAAIIMRWAPEV